MNKIYAPVENFIFLIVYNLIVQKIQLVLNYFILKMTKVFSNKNSIYCIIRQQ